MNIIEIKGDRRAYMPLLLIADEQTDMIEKYIDRGRMFAVRNDEIAAVCIVTDEGGGAAEIKNIAVLPRYRRQGCGRALIDFVCRVYRVDFDILQAGTGDSPLTVPFYEACGFKRSHIVKDFFINNYDHEIIECGVKLTDMVYFVKYLKGS